jgi:hypothetical protein
MKEFNQRRRSLFVSPLATEQAQTPERGNQDTFVGYLLEMSNHQQIRY